MSLRSLLRDALVWVGTIPLAPLWVCALIERRLRPGDGFFASCSELLSLIPGKLGIFLRRSFYRMTLDNCALDCHIGFGSTFAHPQATIGRGVYVGNRCTLGMATIEDHVTIGSNVDILSGRRQHDCSAPGVLVQEQPRAFRTISIGRNSWVGNSAVVMADIGADCVIGAGSVVVQAIPDWSTAVGNPAKVKKMRQEGVAA